jgi:hypothetical protein
MPDMSNLPKELPYSAVVRRSPVILVVAPELGVKGFLLLIHRHVAVFLAPFGNRRQAPSEPLVHRSHMHCELSLSTACADEREAKEIQSAGFHPPPLRISLSKPPEFHQPRLVRVERQTVLRSLALTGRDSHPVDFIKRFHLHHF